MIFKSFEEEKADMNLNMYKYINIKDMSRDVASAIVVPSTLQTGKVRLDGRHEEGARPALKHPRTMVEPQRGNLAPESQPWLATPPP